MTVEFYTPQTLAWELNAKFALSLPDELLVRLSAKLNHEGHTLDTYFAQLICRDLEESDMILMNRCRN